MHLRGLTALSAVALALILDGCGSGAQRSANVEAARPTGKAEPLVRLCLETAKELGTIARHKINGLEPPVAGRLMREAVSESLAVDKATARRLSQFPASPERNAALASLASNDEGLRAVGASVKHDNELPRGAIILLGYNDGGCYTLTNGTDGTSRSIPG